MDTPLNDSICNVAAALAVQASRRPDATAMHHPVRTLFRGRRYAACTYLQLHELSNAYAAGMAQFGIAAGTRTALMLQPGLDFFAVFFALLKAGAVPVLRVVHVPQRLLCQPPFEAQHELKVMQTSRL